MNIYTQGRVAPSIDKVLPQNELASVLIRGDLALIRFDDDYPALVIPTQVARSLYKSLGEQLDGETVEPNRRQLGQRKRAVS